MIWNHPAALAGLALLAAPALVHLLIRRHAARVVFPGMRFVPATRAAAVRLRSPSDVGLLMLRMGIVAAAVLAVAQPLLVTAARTRAWNARVARAVIVDTSPSVSAAIAGRLADEATKDAFASRRFDSTDVRDALRRASEWLATASAPRRAIVVVSDFQRGAIDEADIAGIPASTGIVAVRAGTPAAAGRFGKTEGWRQARWEPLVAIDAASTQVTWERRGDDGRAALTVRAAAADQPAADRAAAVARSFGVPAGDPSHRIDVAFAGAAGIPDGPPATPWIAAAAIALRRSSLLAETGAQVGVGERSGVMTVAVPLPATSALAPAIVRAVLLAAAPPVADPETETTTIEDATLAKWRREPAPPASVEPSPEDGDGRWLWALALGLLVLEGVARRSRSSHADAEAHADAA
jgi:hypothetical protein